MMQINDRVYDKQHNAHGYVIAVNEENSQAKVQYFWAKYSKLFPPRRIWQKATNDKQAWVDFEALTITPKPSIERNAVSMFGNRSLDRLIRLITEIPYRRIGDGSDIILHYGNGHSYSGDALVINSRPIWNKYEQCKLLRGLVPDILSEPRDGMGDDWIVKPFQSIGGQGIAKWDGMNHRGKYLQREVKKVREFRAHCFLWASEKVPLIQEKMISDKNRLRWNKKQGSVFHYPYAPRSGRDDLEPELRERISDMAIEATKRLKYDFGGIDLALDEDGELWIFEVNSRMGLREMSFATYKPILWELYNIDIDDYKATRWNVPYRPILNTREPDEVRMDAQDMIEQFKIAELGTYGYDDIVEAQQDGDVAVIPTKYQSFNLADREVNIG